MFGRIFMGLFMSFVIMLVAVCAAMVIVAGIRHTYFYPQYGAPAWMFIYMALAWFLHVNDPFDFFKS